MDVAEALDAELRAASVPGRAEQEKRYLKSELRHHGTPVPAVRAVVKGFRRSHPDGADVQAIARELWAEPVHERRLLAAFLLEAYPEARDLALIEQWIREARTWALVDVLAGDVVGRMPEPLTPVLDRWAADPDVWLRRSALLAHLRPLRAGAGDWPRFTRYADPLLDDRSFWIRKALGWVLRDTAKRRPDLVTTWLTPRAPRASGITLREALKPLTPEQRARITGS